MCSSDLSDFAVVDVGLKTEGRVPLKEFAMPGMAPAVKVGDEVEVYVERVENAMGEAVLSGKIKYTDLDNYFQDKIALVHTQDYVAQVGQGAVADRTEEHLGRSDVGIIVFRKIWERELTALAEGRPLKKWALPQESIYRFQEATMKSTGTQD